MKPRSALALIFFFFAINSIVAQQASTLLLYEQNADQVSVLKSMLAMHDFEESTFWVLYEQYEAKLKILKSQTFESLQQLTLNKDASKATAKVTDLLSNEEEEAELRKEYFEKISSSTNGKFALQFLQSETLFDLLIKSRLYEKLAWDKPTWNPVFLTDESVKMSVIEFTLGIPRAAHDRFVSLLEDFEFEYSRVVGHQFVFFEQCLDDVNELTPRQCKTLGDTFTSMQQKETRVKEIFFQQMTDAYDPNVAARFIALEEYFAVMAKLKIWSDYLSLDDK